MAGALVVDVVAFAVAGERVSATATVRPIARPHGVAEKLWACASVVGTCAT
jgi:hypothetical protein